MRFVLVCNWITACSATVIRHKLFHSPVPACKLPIGWDQNVFTCYWSIIFLLICNWTTASVRTCSLTGIRHQLFHNQLPATIPLDLTMECFHLLYYWSMRFVRSGRICSSSFIRHQLFHSFPLAEARMFFTCYWSMRFFACFQLDHCIWQNMLFVVHQASVFS